MTGSTNPRVAIVYKSMPQYRVEFFEGLYEQLDRLGIDLDVIYGQSGPTDAAKQDRRDLEHGTTITNRILTLAGREIYWQPCLKLLNGTDLVIVEQASKLLLNYVLFAQQPLGRKLAFWGHGKNFQDPNRSRVGECVKRQVSRHVHWWFAYNDLSASVVQSLGFPVERISVVNNAIDTRALVEARDSVSATDIETIRAELGLSGDNVCLFCGSMHRDKRLEFLLEAAVLIREEVPDFELIFLGAGPEQGIVEQFVGRFPWAKLVGPRFGRDKAAYFALSKLSLLPGLVGLGVLDSFALATPLVTTNITFHSPEIDYLKSEENGLIVEDDVRAYAAGVAALLRDRGRLARLEAGCRRDALSYTVEEMVSRFSAGVVGALAG